MRWSRVTSIVDRPAALAVAAFVFVRVVGLLAIVIASQLHHGDVDDALGKSDGVWYLGIARHGYGPPPPIGPDGTYTHLTSLAFFPLYPLLIRLVALPDVPYLVAALLVTAFAGVMAAGLIATWARPLVGDRGAVSLVAVWSLLPSSAVLGMAYSEATFTAAAAACLLALQRRKWLTAAVAAVLGGLTRPTGGALVVAVAVAVAVEAWPRRRLDGRMLAAVLLAPLGVLASLAHVAVVTGRWDGWFWLERTVWRSGFDGGRSAFLALRAFVTGGPPVRHAPLAVAAVVVVLFVVLTVRMLLGRRPRPRPADATFAFAAGLLAVGERRYFYVKPRLLLIAFPVLLPVARRLAALSTRSLLLMAVPLLLLASAYNAYLVVVWPRAL